MKKSSVKWRSSCPWWDELILQHNRYMCNWAPVISRNHEHVYFQECLEGQWLFCLVPAEWFLYVSLSVSVSQNVYIYRYDHAIIFYDVINYWGQRKLQLSHIKLNGLSPLWANACFPYVLALDQQNDIYLSLSFFGHTSTTHDVDSDTHLRLLQLKWVILHLGIDGEWQHFFCCDVLMYTCLRCNGALTKPPLKFGCGAINEPGIPRRCNYIFMSHIKSYIFHLPRDCCWMVFQLPCCMVYWRLKTHADKINANTPFHSLASGRFQFDFG